MTIDADASSSRHRVLLAVVHFDAFMHLPQAALQRRANIRELFTRSTSDYQQHNIQNNYFKGHA
eukprot:520725-Lingulodinium_polyedra.AAC.1